MTSRSRYRDRGWWIRESSAVIALGLLMTVCAVAHRTLLVNLCTIGLVAAVLTLSESVGVYEYKNGWRS